MMIINKRKYYCNLPSKVLFVSCLVTSLICMCQAGEDAQIISRLGSNLMKCKAVSLVRCLAVTDDLRVGKDPEPDNLGQAYTCEVVETFAIVPADEPWRKHLTNYVKGSKIQIFMPKDRRGSFQHPGWPGMFPHIAYLIYLFPCPQAVDVFKTKSPLDRDRCFEPLAHPTGALSVSVFKPGESATHDEICLRDYGSIDPHEILRGVRRIAECLTKENQEERIAALAICRDDTTDPVSSRAAAVLLAHEEALPTMVVPDRTKGPGLVAVSVVPGDVTELTAALRQRRVSVGIAWRANAAPVGGKPNTWNAITLKDLVDSTLATVKGRSAIFGVDSVYLGLDDDPVLAHTISKQVTSNDEHLLAWSEIVKRLLPPKTELDQTAILPDERGRPDDRPVTVDISVGARCAEALLQLCAAYGEGMSFDLVSHDDDTWKISFHIEQKKK